MDLNEILRSHATSILGIQELLKKFVENFESIEEYNKKISAHNKEVCSYLRSSKSELDNLTALVQVLREEVLELRKKVDK